MESNFVKLPPNFDIRATSASSEWKFWKCLFEDYLISVGQDEATDKVKLSLLRNMMGPESTKVILSFKMSKTDSETYSKVVEQIDKYVNPKSNEVFERFKFNERKQEEGESFENFYTSLRQLVVNCDYTSTVIPIEDQLLRDRIVQGIADKGLQESLLRIDDLTLDKAAHMCRASEISKSQVKEMNPSVEIDAVIHKYNKKVNVTNNKNFNNKDNKFQCRRCQTQHGPRECPAFGKKCAKCGIFNHLAVSCRVKKVQEAIWNESGESDDTVFCGAVSASAKEWTEEILIEDKKVKCKLDTGADGKK